MTSRFLRLGSLLAFGCALAPTAAAQTVDILEIIILKANPADGPNPNPYTFDVTIDGSGLNFLTVEAKGGFRGPVLLQPGGDPGSYFYESSYPTLVALRNDWPAGDYQIDVNLGSLVLNVTHGPSEPLAPTQMLVPLPGDRCVPLPLTLEWGNCGGCGGSDIFVALEDSSGGQEVFELLPMTDTLWTPPPGFLQPGTTYTGFSEVVDLEYQTTLPGGAEYISAFVLENSFEFQTAFQATEQIIPGSPPNPNALLPGILGPALLGKMWAPRIDHTSFAPSAAIDILALDMRGPINLPRPFGTLLLLPPPSDQLFLSTPGTPFQLSIPPDCQLAGLEVMTQGLSFVPQQGIELTNGILLQLGSQ